MILTHLKIFYIFYIKCASVSHQAVVISQLMHSIADPFKEVRTVLDTNSLVGAYDIRLGLMASIKNGSTDAENQNAGHSAGSKQ